MEFSSTEAQRLNEDVVGDKDFYWATIKSSKQDLWHLNNSGKFSK